VRLKIWRGLLLALGFFAVVSCLATSIAKARVPAGRSTRSEIMRRAPIGARFRSCFAVYLASQGSPWALVRVVNADLNQKPCDQGQLGGLIIMHRIQSGWVLVESSDENGCPVVVRPQQAPVPSQIVLELTGLHCPGPTPGPLPQLPTESTGADALQVRPREVDFTGDGTGFLGGYTSQRSVNKRNVRNHLPFGSLVWTKWTKTVAIGTGAMWLDNGIPDEASGTFFPYQASVTAFRPQAGVLTRMRVSYFSRTGTQKTETFSAHYYPATSYGPAYWAWY
jgi:hypothetical protein